MISKKRMDNFLQAMKVGLGLSAFILASGVRSVQAGVDDDFANGKSIELVTSNGLLRVNMYENRNGAPIFGLEPDGSSDQKFIVEWQPGYGFKLRKKDTNFYITTQKYPSPSLGLMEGWTKTADNNAAATFVALSSNKAGYYNICLKYQQSQCLNLPNQKRLVRFTTYQRSVSDADQQFKPVAFTTPPAPSNISGNTAMLPFSKDKSVKITQGNFGWEQTSHSQSFYNGFNLYAVDFGLSEGSEVRSVRKGLVVYAGWKDGGWGNVVVIKYSDNKYGHYEHLKSVNVGYNQSVSGGALIGFSGNTGASEGPHLHYHEAQGSFLKSVALPSFYEGNSLVNTGATVISKNVDNRQ
jgi:murein DD-endopeptidase MepM/ murein hydrolase activator NlpD